MIKKVSLNFAIALCGICSLAFANDMDASVPGPVDSEDIEVQVEDKAEGCCKEKSTDEDARSESSTEEKGDAESTTKEPGLEDTGAIVALNDSEFNNKSKRGNKEAFLTNLRRPVLVVQGGLFNVKKHLNITAITGLKWFTDVNFHRLVDLNWNKVTRNYMDLDSKVNTKFFFGPEVMANDNMVVLSFPVGFQYKHIYYSVNPGLQFNYGDANLSLLGAHSTVGLQKKAWNVPLFIEFKYSGGVVPDFEYFGVAAGARIKF